MSGSGNSIRENRSGKYRSATGAGRLFQLQKTACCQILDGAGNAKSVDNYFPSDPSLPEDPSLPSIEKKTPGPG